MPVTIIDFKERVNADGEPFNALILEGDVEMVKSKETGKYYATARRASTTSTFSEERCKQLIGTTMPGTIKKVSCPEYSYTIPETGEVISLEHTYEYVPEEEPSMEDEVFERKNGANKPALV
jgi:hypothetical protein